MSESSVKQLADALKFPGNQVTRLNPIAAETKNIPDIDSRQSSVIHDSRDAIFISDESGYFLMVNSAASTLTGYSEKELLRMRITDLHDEEDLHAFNTFHKKILSGQEIITEAKVLRKDKHKILVEFNNRCIRLGDQVHVYSIAYDISGRKLKEEQLKLIRFAIDSSGDATFIINAKGKFIYVNDAAAESLGYTREELMQRGVDDISEKVVEESGHSFRQKLKSNRTSSFESRHIRKDGSVFPVEVKGNYIEYDGNEYNCAFARDITERNKAVLALSVAETKFRNLVENINDVIFIVDGKGMINYISPAVVQISSFSVEEVIGRDFRDFVCERDLEELENNFKNAVAGKSTPSEFRILNKKGPPRWVRSSGKPIIRNGKFIGMQGVLADIHDKKKAEEALRRSEEKYRMLFENTRDAIYISTHDGQFVDMNTAMTNLLGYSKEELFQVDVGDLYIDVHQRRKFQAEIGRVGAVKDFEITLRTKEGKPRDCLLTSSIWKNRDGLVEGYHGVIRDVTEQKLIEKELERAYRLEAAGKLAGQIAHDFNNLLSPLVAYPALIREELPEGHPVLEMVDEMEFTANQIAAINQQLLSLGRRGHYNFEALDLNSLSHQVILTQQLPNEIDIVEEFSLDLFLIKGGEGQLTRALINLIQNANEAMKGAGQLTLKTDNVYLEQPLIGYKTIKRGEYVNLSITDSGGGIKPDIIDKIFDPFFTTKMMDRQRGSGLGLSVVHGVVEDSDGYITVETEVGQGTAFSLYFPIAREFKPLADSKIYQENDGNETILVVDDDPLQRKVIDQLLRKSGYQVHTVASGEEALDFVNKKDLDLLVLDMVMEGMDGTETYRQILQTKPMLPAVILSGYAMSDRVREALRLGASQFISKPVMPNALMNSIRTVLDRKDKSLR